MSDGLKQALTSLWQHGLEKPDVMVVSVGFAEMLKAALDVSRNRYLPRGKRWARRHKSR